MRIKIISVVALCFAGSLVCRGQVSTANVSDHKAEAGFFYTGINLKGFGETINGLGGRVAYNLNKNFAIDAEFSFSPETKLGNKQSGQKTQLLAGLKAGVRSRRVGVFAKARPGVMFIGEVTSGFSCSGTTFGQTCRPSHNNFALDVGGVLEVYPSARTIVRFDAGDTIVRIRNGTSGLIGPPVVTNSTTHNFQFSVGVGYRF